VSKVEGRRKESIWRKKVTIFGVTMEFRFWITGFIFLIIAIICFTLPFILTPITVDLVSIGFGIVSTLLTLTSWIYGASREQVNTLIIEFREFRQEMSTELKTIRSLLEEILKTFRERR